MCGFVGSLSGRPIDLECLLRSSKALEHRGPDGSGLTWMHPDGQLQVHQNETSRPEIGDAHVAIAHRRLAILDTSELAKQPMVSGGVALCFNGVIYNYRELRDDLKHLGYSFRSTGDTEVVLKAYLEWGTDCFSRFEGMWAIAFLDSVQRKLILSRDRFGIKPLFWAVSNGSILFSSEIKGLQVWPGVSETPNVTTAAKYLLTGHSDTTMDSWFEGVSRFPVGSWAELSLDATYQSLPECKKFWSLDHSREECTLARKDQLERFFELLDRSVGAHLVSDVPSGTCLSGGVDSTSIAALARAKSGTSYTHRGVGYVADTDALSELKFMHCAAEKTGLDLSEVRVSADKVIENLSTIINAHDEPFGSPSAIAQWFVFKRAREEGLSVMLDGQGADEILGGYTGYILTRARADFLSGDFKSYSDTKRSWETTSGTFPLTAPRILMRALLPNFGITPKFSTNNTFRDVCNDGIHSQIGNLQVEERPSAHVLNDVLANDVSSNILPALLRYEDTNSMAHSIESRVPFLDHKLVEYCFKMGDDQKVVGMKRKKILTEAMQGLVPTEILSRTDKIGFTAQPSWLREIVSTFGAELIENRTDIEKEWFNSYAVAKFIKTAEMGSNQLWRLVNTKLWCRKVSNVDLF